MAKKNKYAFLRGRVALAIIGLVIGLFSGFKVANSQYRRALTNQQMAALRNPAARPAGTTGGADAGHATAEVSAVIERARANPNDAEAQMEAASQFIQIERPNEAMSFLNQANQAKPNDPRVTAGLGVAHFMLGDFAESARWLKQSRALGATEPTVTSLLIGAYIEQGKNLDEADKLLKELEGQGIDPTKVARIRADLDAARTGKRAAAPNQSGKATAPNKTVLSHGPENAPNPEKR